MPRHAKSPRAANVVTKEQHRFMASKARPYNWGLLPHSGYTKMPNTIVSMHLTCWRPPRLDDHGVHSNKVKIRPRQVHWIRYWGKRAVAFAVEAR